MDERRVYRKLANARRILRRRCSWADEAKFLAQMPGLTREEEAAASRAIAEWLERGRWPELSPRLAAQVRVKMLYGMHRLAQETSPPASGPPLERARRLLVGAWGTQGLDWARAYVDALS